MPRADDTSDDEVVSEDEAKEPARYLSSDDFNHAFLEERGPRSVFDTLQSYAKNEQEAKAFLKVLTSTGATGGIAGRKEVLEEAFALLKPNQEVKKEMFREDWRKIRYSRTKRTNTSPYANDLMSELVLWITKTNNFTGNSSRARFINGIDNLCYNALSEPVSTKRIAAWQNISTILNTVAASEATSTLALPDKIRRKGGYDETHNHFVTQCKFAAAYADKNVKTEQAAQSEEAIVTHLKGVNAELSTLKDTFASFVYQLFSERTIDERFSYRHKSMRMDTPGSSLVRSFQKHVMGKEYKDQLNCFLTLALQAVVGDQAGVIQAETLTKSSVFSNTVIDSELGEEVKRFNTNLQAIGGETAESFLIIPDQELKLEYEKSVSFLERLERLRQENKLCLEENGDICLYANSHVPGSKEEPLVRMPSGFSRVIVKNPAFRKDALRDLIAILMAMQNTKGCEKINEALVKQFDKFGKVGTFTIYGSNICEQVELKNKKALRSYQTKCATQCSKYKSNHDKKTSAVNVSRNSADAPRKVNLSAAEENWLDSIEPAVLSAKKHRVKMKKKRIKAVRELGKQELTYYEKNADVFLEELREVTCQQARLGLVESQIDSGEEKRVIERAKMYGKGVAAALNSPDGEIAPTQISTSKQSPPSDVATPSFSARSSLSSSPTRSPSSSSRMSTPSSTRTLSPDKNLDPENESKHSTSTLNLTLALSQSQARITSPTRLSDSSQTRDLKLSSSPEPPLKLDFVPRDEQSILHARKCFAAAKNTLQYPADEEKSLDFAKVFIGLPNREGPKYTKEEKQTHTAETYFMNELLYQEDVAAKMQSAMPIAGYFNPINIFIWMVYRKAPTTNNRNNLRAGRLAICTRMCELFEWTVYEGKDLNGNQIDNMYGKLNTFLEKQKQYIGGEAFNASLDKLGSVLTRNRGIAKRRVAELTHIRSDIMAMSTVMPLIDKVKFLKKQYEIIDHMSDRYLHITKDEMKSDIKFRLHSLLYNAHESIEKDISPRVIMEEGIEMADHAESKTFTHTLESCQKIQNKLTELQSAMDIVQTILDMRGHSERHAAYQESVNQILARIVKENIEQELREQDRKNIADLSEMARKQLRAIRDNGNSEVKHSRDENLFLQSIFSILALFKGETGDFEKLQTDIVLCIVEAQDQNFSDDTIAVITQVTQKLNLDKLLKEQQESKHFGEVVSSGLSSSSSAILISEDEDEENVEENIEIKIIGEITKLYICDKFSGFVRPEQYEYEKAFDLIKNRGDMDQGDLFLVKNAIQENDKKGNVLVTCMKTALPPHDRLKIVKLLAIYNEAAQSKNQPTEKLFSTIKEICEDLNDLHDNDYRYGSSRDNYGVRLTAILKLFGKATKKHHPELEKLMENVKKNIDKHSSWLTRVNLNMTAAKLMDQTRLKLQSLEQNETCHQSPEDHVYSTNRAIRLVSRAL